MSAMPTAVPGFVAAEFAECLQSQGRMLPADWAEANYRITTGPERGRYRNSRAAYMREIINCWADKTIRQLTLMTSAQVGKTTMMAIGYAWTVDQDAADTLWVMPSEELAAEMGRDRIRPAVEAIPQLRKKYTFDPNDMTSKRFRFTDSALWFAWAKSPATLAGRSTKRAVCDEVNKYPPFSGKEAGPVKLAKERTKNFWDRLLAIASTPTRVGEGISAEFAQSDQRYYHVPCPFCGGKQPLIWDQLKFGDDHDPDRIEAEEDVWYECVACAGKMREQHRTKMLRGGEWVARHPEVKNHRGYHLSVLYSPWVRWSTTAAEFLRSKNRVQDLMNFWNSWLGLDWVEKELEVTEDAIERLKIQYEPGVVPMGGVFLTCGADTQDDGIYYVVRAWGYRDESWLVDWGFIPRTPNRDDDFSTFFDEFLNTEYEHRDGSRMRIRLAFIDSAGHRTSTVYKFTRAHRTTTRAIKGASHAQVRPIISTVVDKRDGFTIEMLDTDYFKTQIHDWRTKQPAVWHIPVAVEKDYVRQVSSEEKVAVKSASGQRKVVWQVREGFVQNHYWDCEGYCAAAAEKVGLRRLVPPEQQVKTPARRGGIRRPDGESWIARR